MQIRFVYLCVIVTVLFVDTQLAEVSTWQLLGILFIEQRAVCVFYVCHAFVLNECTVYMYRSCGWPLCGDSECEKEG